jgi:ABC-2 type transport system ATP-binding protein
MPPMTNSQTTAMLTANGLSKIYGNYHALYDVSFTLARGEVVGFLGPNGAGKSTTMKLLTGFIAPTTGSATIAGYDLVNEPLACRRAIGYLPEELPLYLDMTVTHYLDHVARLKGIPTSSRRREVVDAIDAAWLGENATRHIRKLSKGNRQRVGVAQALLNAPPILILDEPTTGLDPTQVAHFRDLIKKLSEKHTILLSTHILAEVEACCSRVVVVHRGRTVAAESIDALRQRTAQVTRLRIRSRQPDTTELILALNACKWVTMLEHLGDTLIIDAPSDQRDTLVSLVQAHGGLRELIEERRSLEAVFRDLIATAPSLAATSTP